MTALPNLVVLDGLFDDLALETATAAAAGWSVSRWDGTAEVLEAAQAVLHVRTRIDRSLLSQMPNCKVVARFGTGLDTVDHLAASEREIAVVGVRDYCIPELASHTLALAFALDRRIDAARDGRMHVDQSWQDIATQLPMPGRTEATVVGLGSIGTAVTRALVAAGLNVRVVTARAPDVARALGAEPTSLADGLRDARFIFLHTALTSATTHLIDAARLDTLRPEAILVNTARIGLVDEAALTAALEAGKLAGAGLDARLTPDSPLRRLLSDPRLLVTPHIGWYSERSARELRIRTVRAAVAAAQSPPSRRYST